MASLNLSGLALNAIQHTELSEKTAGSLQLKVERAHQSIFTEAVITRITEALNRYYNEPIRLSIEYSNQALASPAAQKIKLKEQVAQDQSAALQSDPVFQSLQQDFSAELLRDSVQTLLVE